MNIAWSHDVDDVLGTHTFLGDPLEVPAGALGSVAGSPGIADPWCVSRCAGHRLAVPGLGERGGQRQPPCAVP